ncbi:HD domain-containing phosphohydrolase [Duganella aceris]|uniref:LuxR family transcriptional regulator n=1 Tax=Duganella aceris TaxID=2703883 RepID=A0ABX0FTU0_9BURK|nr:HD domain-containing phosphohydrolase [Duganella aceris]NGZ88113.1 LuxR family transcriptional regulator [Duganella aceris]
MSAAVAARIAAPVPTAKAAATSARTAAAAGTGASASADTEASAGTGAGAGIGARGQASLVSMSECLRALAFMGDLGMEHPAEPSLRTAALGMTIAQAAGPQPVPLRVIATLANDLEALSRTDGIAAALTLIASKHGPSYPPKLLDTLRRNATEWLADLDNRTICRRPIAPGDRPNEMVSLELMADLIDLQQPWLRGHSRRVAQAALRAAAIIGLDNPTQQRTYRAALLHGLGRGAIPGSIWNSPDPLSATAREQMRLAPYWTLRALRHVNGLELEADIASHVGERLDGSGDFRGSIGAAIPIEAQVLAAASAWIALQSARPWRPAHSPEAAAMLLTQEAHAGRFNPDVADALCGMQTDQQEPTSTPARISLSEREADVLRAISQGLTNKEAARHLSISPRTVNTHVESAFRKLGCTTRASASLKALTLRLI